MIFGKIDVEQPAFNIELQSKDYQIRRQSDFFNTIDPGGKLLSAKPNVVLSADMFLSLLPR